MRQVVLDIETFCCDDDDFLDQARSEIEAFAVKEFNKVKHPSNYKDSQKIGEWYKTCGGEKIKEIRANAEIQFNEKIASTSLDGALGCVAVIGFAIDDREPIALYVDDKNPAAHEKTVIEDFFRIMRNEMAKNSVEKSWRNPIFIGHNIANFDLRFLFQRAVVHGITPPSFVPFHVKPWDETIFDTMTKWAGVGQRIKLDKLCRALGLPGKQGIEGSHVADYIRAGRINEVAEYCKNIDVEQTRQCYKRLTFSNA